MTELKNNVAAYLDNLEVRILWLIVGRVGRGWDPWAGVMQGPLNKLTKTPTSGTKWKRAYSCWLEARRGAVRKHSSAHRSSDWGTF